MIDDKSLEKAYREQLDENIISHLADIKELTWNDAMDTYYQSKLADKIGKGLYGVQYLDYRNLVQVLIETEPELFT